MVCTFMKILAALLLAAFLFLTYSLCVASSDASRWEDEMKQQERGLACDGEEYGDEYESED